MDKITDRQTVHNGQHNQKGKSGKKNNQAQKVFLLPVFFLLPIIYQGNMPEKEKQHAQKDAAKNQVIGKPKGRSEFGIVSYFVFYDRKKIKIKFVPQGRKNMGVGLRAAHNAHSEFFFYTGLASLGSLVGY